MKITMAHGSGGTETSRLIDEVYLSAFGKRAHNGSSDAAVLDTGGKIAYTTDSFVVKPVFFPGGDIGRLAVCGTVNDLLTSGAIPQYLSAGFILEEGLELDDLTAIVRSMARTAEEAGVEIVTGDTKVVEGNGGLYINTSGLGMLNRDPVCFSSARPGDSLIVTGTLGDHHACIMSARMGIQNDITSDAAPLCAIVRGLADSGITPAGMRDVTRGGLATVLWEICRSYGLGAVLRESELPVSAQVTGLCSILGLDPLYMGNEGVMLISVAQKDTPAALKVIRSKPYGGNARCIGQFLPSVEGVSLRTTASGRRMLAPLSGEGLPRIC